MGDHRRGIQWDEENLASNEIIREEIREHVGKIEEAKTPYNYDYGIRDDEDGDEDGPGSPSSVKSASTPEKHGGVHFGDLREALETRHEEITASPESKFYLDSQEEHHADFVAKRKAHYNMGAVLRGQVSMGDDDEEDSDEGDGGACEDSGERMMED